MLTLGDRARFSVNHKRKEWARDDDGDGVDEYLILSDFRLGEVHAPGEPGDLDPHHPARARLAFDELLASQLAIALVRHHNKTLAGRATRGDGSLQKRVVAALPFQLTDRKSVV